MVKIDMEMPKSCHFDCKLRHPTRDYCLITGTPLQASGKPINCPLQEAKSESIAEKGLAEAVLQKYDAFLATQLTLIAKEKGVSVADLCLRHNDIFTHIQRIDGDIKFWVEVK